MFRYSGGERVKRGTYWNFSTGKRIRIVNHDVLPGDSGTAYYKLSPIGILVLGPLFGLLYAAMLPFIGLAMMAKMLGQKSFGRAAETVGRGISFGWRPGEAYLGGKKKKDRPEEKQ
ncbi:MAG: hypothetical protein AB1805_09700 [Nitrospirota bacterium]